MKKILLTCFFVLLASSLFFPALAAETPKKADWQAAFEKAVLEVGVEQAVADVIASGVDAGVCVKVAIEMGYNPYSVIKAAIAAGGDLSRIVEVAREFKVSTAVISKAAVDAGAEILGVAQMQSQAEDDGFAYTPPPEDVAAPAAEASVTYMPLTAEDAEAAAEENAAPAADASLVFAQPEVGPESSPEEAAPPGTGTFSPIDLLAGLPVGGGTDPVISSPYIP